MSHDDSDLAEIARRTRERIETWVAGSVADLNLGADTARGLCRLSSNYLYEELHGAGYQPRLVQGVVHCDQVDSRLEPFLAAAGHLDAVHYWVMVGDVVLDITADQFNYRLADDLFPTVLIESASNLPRHISCAEILEPSPPACGWPEAFSRERARVSAQD